MPIAYHDISVHLLSQEVCCQFSIQHKPVCSVYISKHRAKSHYLKIIQTFHIRHVSRATLTISSRASL